MGKPRGRPSKENKTTNAERYKLYREKHKESYKAEDALRKIISREQIKLNPTENRLRLQCQAASKKAQRQKRKLLTNQIMTGNYSGENYHRLLGNLSLGLNDRVDPEPTEPSTPTPGSSYKHN